MCPFEYSRHGRCHRDHGAASARLDADGERVQGEFTGQATVGRSHSGTMVESGKLSIRLHNLDHKTSQSKS